MWYVTLKKAIGVLWCLAVISQMIFSNIILLLVYTTQVNSAFGVH